MQLRRQRLKCRPLILILITITVLGLGSCSGDETPNSKSDKKSDSPPSGKPTWSTQGQADKPVSVDDVIGGRRRGAAEEDDKPTLSKDSSPPLPLTEEERQSAFERLWSDPDEITVTTEAHRQKWSKEDRDRTSGSSEEVKDDAEMTDTERVVQAIKMRFANPDAVHVVEPPNLGGQEPFGDGIGGVATKKFKLVINQQSITPVEPITNLLNKRKEPEVPADDEEPEIITAEGLDKDERHSDLMYKQALELLGPSASRDSTGYHVITSVGKTEKVEQAYVLLQQAALRGHKKAMEIVAWGQLLGPLPLDIEAAKDKFESLAKKGYPNSQMAMGFLHANALEAELNGALPILHYTFSSIAGASWSQMALGYRYWGGIGVTVSCEKALEQYRRVAATVASEVSEVGTGPAIQRIRLLDEIEGTTGTATSSSGSTGNILNSDILDYYTMLAERGDLQAQVGLGQLHFQGGRGVSPDHHLALRYFRRAADAGSPVAMAFLGKMYLEGNDAVESDTAKALKWFQRAAEQGSPVGQSGLGLMYLTGKGLPKDPSTALKYFTMAAEQGWVDGQLHLGNMYMTGIGVRREYQQAAKYYNLAAQSGHILAIYNLAQMHATGTGMMRSCTAAVELYKTVAERGRWGLLLSEAHNDYKERRFSHALVKYLLLAELGYEAAQSNAGYMLERGEVGNEIFEGWRALVNGRPPKTPSSSDIQDQHPPKQQQQPGSDKSEDVGVDEASAGKQTSDHAKEDEKVQPPTPTDPEQKATTGESSSSTSTTSKKYDLMSPESILSRALQQWSRSAAQGYSSARVRLGDYYYYGMGTSTDYSSAATQYRLASEQQRNPQAMFNLAYMHEQGLGLKQDLHLAKRFYDMAAETSSDARVPVTLALIKLNFISTLQALNLFDFDSDSTTFVEIESLSSFTETLDLSNNWDLYLLTILVGILGLLVWIRRPPQGGLPPAG